MTLFGKLADRGDGRLMSLNNHLLGAWMPVSCIAQRGGGDEEVESKGHKICKYPLEWPASGRGCVNFFFPAAILRRTGSGCSPEQRHFGLTEGQGSPGQALMHRLYPFGEQKQQEATIKGKKQIQHGVRIGSSLLPFLS